MLQKNNGRKVSLQTYIILGVIIISTFFFMGRFFVVSIYRSPQVTIADEVDASTTIGLANSLEEQFQQWQPDLFLQSYTVTYEIVPSQLSALINSAHFRFAGYRQDWLGNWLAQSHANHVIIWVEVDITQKKIVDYSYSHGQAFGFDAPLNLMNWAINERELLSICGQYGGDNFQLSYSITKVHVSAVTTRIGREWEVSYNASPQYFNCLINIDSGKVMVQTSDGSWQNVGNLYGDN